MEKFSYISNSIIVKLSDYHVKILKLHSQSRQKHLYGASMNVVVGKTVDYLASLYLIILTMLIELF